jgi:hypothetical protein
MTISPTSRAALERLYASASAFLRDLEAMEPESDGSRGAAGNVRRYLAILRKGWSDDDTLAALKGANLLTTINKGMADSGLDEAERTICENAFAVCKDASDAARSLRADAAMAI